MTKAEMIAYLKGRYEGQAEKFPVLPKDVTLAQYVSANLPYMLRSHYWQSRDCGCDVDRQCNQHGGGDDIAGITARIREALK